MINYLDLLLTGEWEEEKEPFAWKKHRVGRPAKGSGSKQEPVVHEKGLGGQEQPRQMQLSPTELEPVEQVTADLERQLAQLQRVAARSQVLRSDTPRQRLEAGTVMPQSDGRSTRKWEMHEVGAQRRLAEQMDAAFERDARRYDGPMGLY